ncbi:MULTISPECIES: Rpn family recombination-promoting nuclease/putative transposase [unclassified Janthinobacterium]|uniref:Rpn family recombination-promoting nuclease/putative transposase n=1 Tax=unclassified Janthinobacterium TaxID=2610881 RepID=UPI000344B0D0|nr:MULTISPECIES: Rpn family recombination-promoting nuclease/putative transposase [unclassified Janthinobacterium]MEC5164225.1 hypothetical protein [Janthinobacterium sp. CG_S6]
MAEEHDSGYKQLFSHPEMVRDLLSGFLPYAWARQLDLAAFERVNASYVSDTGRQRHEDMVWRLKLGAEWVYLYILLEFQSRNDHWMALRMQVYVGLLCQDLVKRRELTHGGKLAPVLPIVLYNGAARWSASTDLAQLMLAPPEGLASLQPGQRYLLIDRHSYHGGAAGAQFNLVAAVFRLEHFRNGEDLIDVVAALADWLNARECEPLRTSLVRWIGARLRHQLKSHNMVFPDDLAEVHTMLTRKFETLADEWEYNGIQRGLERGRQEGHLQADRSRLQFLLQRRFGQLPPAIAARVEAAPAEQLERWFEGLLDADSLDQLVGGA